ncbi:MAG TPA: DUF1697 domain-containing protein [Anaerolineae bacterium]|nr:DUF1697 domain-containing protein [Anaerolineae bacterium]
MVNPKIMNTYIALLRGINVGGKNKLKMAELRGQFTALGYAHVQSYVQSGNLLFDSAESDPAQLENEIRTMLLDKYGYTVSVMVRPPDLFARIVEENPYLARCEDTKQLYVTFLAAEPDPAAIAAIKIPASTGDAFSVAGRVLYFFCPGSYGRTKFNNNFFERKLGVAATTRNWRTVNKLLTLTQR